MARADYIGCAVCDGKGLYDGHWEIRDREDVEVAVLCTECAKTHHLKALPKLEPLNHPPQPREAGSHD